MLEVPEGGGWSFLSNLQVFWEFFRTLLAQRDRAGRAEPRPAAVAVRERRPGWSAAPRRISLPLLPSGPGGVRSLLSHRARSSFAESNRSDITPLYRTCNTQRREGDLNPRGDFRPLHDFQSCSFSRTRTSLPTERAHCYPQQLPCTKRQLIWQPRSWTAGLRCPPQARLGGERGI